jgi:hypothetical protein
MITADFYLSIGPTLLFHETTATALDPTNHWRYTGQTSIIGKLHSGRCYIRIRGNGFRLLNPTQDIPCIGGNREPRRATTDVHSLPAILFYVSCDEMGTSPLFRLSLFLFFFFNRSLRSLSLIHALFGDQGPKGNIKGRTAGLEAIGSRFLSTLVLGVLWGEARLLVPVEFG